MGLNSDKTSKVFCINICCFYSFAPRWHRLTKVSSELCTCSISSYTASMQNVRCAVMQQRPLYSKETVLIFLKVILRDVTVIEFLICYSVAKFIKIGSRVRTLDAKC